MGIKKRNPKRFLLEEERLMNRRVLIIIVLLQGQWSIGSLFPAAVPSLYFCRWIWFSVIFYRSVKWQKYEIQLCSIVFCTKSSFLTMLLLISNCSHTEVFSCISSIFVCVRKDKAELKNCLSAHWIAIFPFFFFSDSF